MQATIIRYCWISLFALTAGSLSGCHLLGQDRLRSRVDIQQEHLAASLPAKLPQRVYVADFRLDAANYRGDQGVRGALPGRLEQHLGGVGQALPSPLATGDPAAAAARIVDQLAADITRGLQDQGIAAQRLGAATDPLPGDGWLIDGVFTQMDEGNRIQRATVGFGKGAVQMDVQVGISDLAGSNPRAAFAVFGTITDPSKLPGGAVTHNPYVMAAKFVLDRNATAKDVSRTADQIVAELLKFREQVRQSRRH